MCQVLLKESMEAEENMEDKRNEIVDEGACECHEDVCECTDKEVKNEECSDKHHEHKNTKKRNIRNQN